MTTLTFLGATGGAGTTTLVAATLLSHRSGVQTLPELSSHDPATLEARIGRSFPAVFGDRRIADAGRCSRRKLLSALTEGHVVLVAPTGVRGDQAVVEATADLDTPDRRILGPHVSVVRVDVHGTDRRAAPEEGTLFTLPYDSLLAHGSGMAPAWGRLHRRTTGALQGWGQILDDHLWRTAPIDPAHLRPMRPSPSVANPWLQGDPAER